MTLRAGHGASPPSVVPRTLRRLSPASLLRVNLALVPGFENWASLPFWSVSLDNLLPTWKPKLGTWRDL